MNGRRNRQTSAFGLEVSICERQIHRSRERRRKWQSAQDGRDLAGQGNAAPRDLAPPSRQPVMRSVRVRPPTGSLDRGILTNLAK